MTQVELPQLSLRRYFDLVKRRRWQVLPVSLLGLVLGGIIAFFIPRYYVAETTLWHQSVGKEERTEDPMRSIVASASEMIPLVARKVVVEKLKWPEVADLDAHDLEQFAKSVQSRVKVNDRNAGVQRRDFALIQVAYRDRDGKRAAAFLNAAVKTWIDTRVEEMRKPVELERKQAAASVASWTETYEQLLAAKRELELRFQFEPDVDVAVQRAGFLERQKTMAKAAEDLKAKAAELAGLDRLLELERARLAELPARVPSSSESLAAVAAQSEAGRVLLAQMQIVQLELEFWRQGTRQLRDAKRRLAAAEKQLQALVAPKTESPDGLLDNPLHALQRKAVEEIEVKQAIVAKAVEVLRATVAVDDKLKEGRIEGFGEYDQILRNLAEAKTSRDRAIEDRSNAESLLAKLSSEAPVYQLNEAAVPPRPTEPNILIVALIGCVLGLGAAIALILLLDLLQGSFKTMDDVERLLPVPVLGGLSHLETEEERSTAQRSRTRASVVAFTFVGLVVAVATIFYLDPTRLPPVVRDLMALVLGGR